MNPLPPNSLIDAATSNCSSGRSGSSFPSSSVASAAYFRHLAQRAMAMSWRLHYAQSPAVPGESRSFNAEGHRAESSSQLVAILDAALSICALQDDEEEMPESEHS
jgi:hypothetical protein